MDSAVAQARDAYIAANPRSAAAHKAATAHMPGGNTRTVIHASPFPLTFTKGEGATLTSLDGDTYVDFLGEYTAGLFGHSNRAIQAAVNAALSQGWSFGGPHAHERALAAGLCARFAPAVERLRFTNSGTEANTYALAAALAWTGRRQILVFANGYHGGSIGFVPGAAASAMLLPHDWVVAPYNDIRGTRAALARAGAGNLAAVLVEPMQGSGGAVPASAEFLRFLRATADAHAALLIFDEVMTSRLARGGLGQSLGVRPDLVTLGKWIGGGMTVGAFGGRADVMAQFDPDRAGALRHAGTFNNNVVSMAAGVAGLAIFDDAAQRALNARGDALLRGVAEALREAGMQNPAVDGESSDGETRAWVSGRGSILAVHFAGPHGEALKALFWHHMLAQGVYLAPRGFVSLNLETRDAHVEQFVAGVRSFAARHLAQQPRL